jgi:hypothetical protein
MMSTPQTQGDPFAEFGGTAEATPTTPAATSTTPDPFAEFGGTAQATQTEGGPSPEEQAFLTANPDHVYLKADPKFPNRPEGIYPTGKGNEWRKDPSYEQEPIDLHLLKHTAEGALAGALGAGAAPATAAIAETLPAVLPHTIAGVKAIGAWANAHPFYAWALYNAIKEYLPGAKKAIGFIKNAPTGE